MTGDSTDGMSDGMTEGKLRRNRAGPWLALASACALALPLAAAADIDGDGVPDPVDNCLEVPNAGPAFCDTDEDGYGNACDGDFDQAFRVNANDWVFFFSPDFAVALDSGVGSDIDCDGDVDAIDANLFLDQFEKTTPGPSGLSCAGVPPCF